MKLLATLLLSLSLQGAHISSLPKAPHDKTMARHAHKGTWYFAENGHAVYCYGPVMTVPQPDGNLKSVATFCQGDQTGDQTMVPLRD
jgi:hypothetical protein